MDLGKTFHDLVTEKWPEGLAMGFWYHPRLVAELAVALVEEEALTSQCLDDIRIDGGSQCESIHYWRERVLQRWDASPADYDAVVERLKEKEQPVWYWKCEICEEEFPHDYDKLGEHAWDHQADHPEMRSRLEDGENYFEELERVKP